MFDDGDYDQVDQVEDYSEDEWYDDYDDEQEYGFYAATLDKAGNGHLFVSVVYALTNGHTDSFFWSWYEQCESISDYRVDFRERAIEWSRTHKAGESIDIDDLMHDEDEDDE